MTFLKLKNTTILEFNIDTDDYYINHENLLPFSLRNSLIDSRNKDFSLNAARNNYQMLISFLFNRSISIKRTNAKRLLNALHISQGNDIKTKIDMMLLCKALSASDYYWLSNNPNERWENVNLWDNPLHEAIAQISLTGVSPLTITGNIRTPELTGQGVYAKAWYRENGQLFLYKANTQNGHESEIEVSVSNILNCTNVPHVEYTLANKDGITCCVCKNICTEKYNLIPAQEVYGWCNRTNKNFIRFTRALDDTNFCKTLIVDYLIANSDRHDQNWGFYMDINSGDLVSLHPLFDHNNAFDERDYHDITGNDSLMLPNASKLEAAKFALKRCNFKFISPLTRTMFPNDKSFACFIERANYIGLSPKVISSGFLKSELITQKNKE